MWEAVLDALKDSAIVLPFLLAIYIVIELLERNEKARRKTVKLLNGKLAPLVAGGIGIIPQCGFSVVATDLYCSDYIKTGTLVAFFVATSDEALPLLLTDKNTIGIVWIVVLVKILYAVLLGFVINIFDKRVLSTETPKVEEEGCCHHEVGDEEHHDGNVFWNFIKHPFLHTLKIFIYIFVINALFGILMFYASDSIVQFVSKIGIWQTPIVAAIGLIPNCASSVIVAEMYSENIIGLPAMLAGLVSNSGIALAVLFKDKEHTKRNLLVAGIMYLAGVLIGIGGELVKLLI